MSITYNTEITTVGAGNGFLESSFATLTGFDNLPSSGSYELIIPNSVTISGTGYEIRQIAANVGANLTGVTKVTFGSGCRIFRSGIFHNCPNLTEVEFTNPYDSEEMSNYANSNKYPPLYYFVSGNLIHNADEYYLFIGPTEDRLFKGCGNLTKITMFSSNPGLVSVLSNDTNNKLLKQINTVVLNTGSNNLMSTVGLKLLQNASAVTSLTFNNPSNIKTIQQNAFQNCTAEDYKLGDMTSLIRIGYSGSGSGSTLIFSGSSITSVTIPASVIQFAEGAFANCSSLTSVTMNNTFSRALFDFNDNTTIRNQFANCPKINTESLKHLYAFVGSNATYFRRLGFSAKQAFDADIPSNYALAAGYTQAELEPVGYDFSLVLTISNNVLTNITGNSLTNVTIPSSVTAISVTACQNKTFIGSLSIPSTVTRILANSFIGCSNLTSLTLPGSRTSSSNSLIPLDANSFALATSPSLIRSNVSVNSLQQLRTQGYSVAQLQDAGFQNVPVTCFGENTRIMCFVDGQEQELMVQDIRNGVLVKTLGSGYKPVCMIGTNKMMNLGNDERVEERLYICKKEKYPELTEDLIITGCHSVLVDDITEEQRNKIMDKFGRIMVTEGKYRLTAAMDERAVPHNCAGQFNIYHFALEHDVYVANYGVYANGLLVESCSKRYLAEIANMTML